MDKKVKGYMINHGGWIEFDQAPDENGPWVPCTMVISDKAHERVFTESEVRAMVIDLIEDQARCDVHNGWQSGVIPDFAGIATKHGVSLDHA
jgi:hypothetical protein